YLISYCLFKINLASNSFIFFTYLTLHLFSLIVLNEPLFLVSFAFLFDLLFVPFFYCLLFFYFFFFLIFFFFFFFFFFFSFFFLLLYYYCFLISLFCFSHMCFQHSID